MYHVVAVVAHIEDIIQVLVVLRESGERQHMVSVQSLVRPPAHFAVSLCSLLQWYHNILKPLLQGFLTMHISLLSRLHPARRDINVQLIE